jgi:putative inorganic carbon (HCO3(-)) transporter
MPDLQSRRAQVALALLGSALALGAAFALAEPAVLLAVAMLPLAAILAFRQPFLLCLLFILFTFFRLHEAFPALNPLRLPQLLALGSLGVLGGLLAFRRIAIAWSPELKLFAWFFAIITLGCLTATGRDLAIQAWTDNFVKIGIMVFAIASLAREPRDFALAARAFVAAGVAVAVVAISNRLGGIGLVEGTRVTVGRDIGSVLGDPNDLSLVLLFPLSFAVALVVTWRTGLLWRVFGLLGSGAIVWAILCTQSRGGLLGIVAVVGALAARRIRSRAILLGGGAVALLLLFAVAGVSGRASGGAGEAGIDESSMGRLEAWKAAVRMAMARPFTGVGLKNYSANFFFYSDWWEGFAKAVHSTWFSVLSEGGWIAFFLFIAMVVTTTRSALRSADLSSPARAGAAYDPATHAMAQALVGGIAGFVVSGTFLTQGFTWPVYILLALSVAVARRIETARG